MEGRAPPSLDIQSHTHCFHHHHLLPQVKNSHSQLRVLAAAGEMISEPAGAGPFVSSAISPLEVVKGSGRRWLGSVLAGEGGRWVLPRWEPARARLGALSQLTLAVFSRTEDGSESGKALTGQVSLFSFFLSLMPMFKSGFSWGWGKVLRTSATVLVSHCLEGVISPPPPAM